MSDRTLEARLPQYGALLSAFNYNGMSFFEEWTPKYYGHIYGIRHDFLIVITGEYKESLISVRPAPIPPLHLTLEIPAIFETSVFTTQATICQHTLLPGSTVGGVCWSPSGSNLAWKSFVFLKKRFPGEVTEVPSCEASFSEKHPVKTKFSLFPLNPSPYSAFI